MIYLNNRKIDEIKIGGAKNEPFKFSEIGYSGEEEPLKSDLTYAKKIYDEWDATQTNLSNKFYSNLQVVYMPLVDTRNVTNMHNMFNYCSSLSLIPLLDTSNVTTMEGMFYGCTILTEIPLLNTSNVTNMKRMFRDCVSLTTIPQLDTSKVTDMFQMFSGCRNLTSVSISNISNVTNMFQMFSGCEDLTEIRFKGNPSKVTDVSDMFNDISETGTLYYDYRYDYSIIINELKRVRPKWVAKPDYEPQECTSLTITADNCIGNSTTTTVHYTAITNGINILTGEHLTGVTVTGDAVSEPFEKNLSETDTKQVTVIFNYLGQTATTTITQGVYIPPTATVDLKGNWELAPSETIPNPEPNLYEGVYQSVHIGQGNVKDKMVITFNAMPTFELYIRSYAETSFDYVYCGKLDQAEPTEYASTKGNQQSGTALENYTKVSYPNDGGEHTITVVYRKDGGGDTGDDRGYVFFTKPQA